MDNCVVRLNELAQKHRLSLLYDERNAGRPECNGRFIIRVVLNNKEYPEGVGYSKKEAKQNAARNALDKLNEEIPANDSVTSSIESRSPVSHGSIKQANYTCWLNEYGQKQKIHITPKESTRLAPVNATHCCKFILGNKEFPEAYGKTRKEAKEEAAKLVYDELSRDTTTEGGDEASKRAVANEMDQQSVSLAGTTLETNYIGLLNEYCQKINKVPNYKMVNRIGPSHNLQFVYKVVIDETEYPEGTGKSAKEAKQKSAQQALDALQKASFSNSQVSRGRDESEDYSSTSCDHANDSSLQDQDEYSESIIFQEQSDVHNPKMESTPTSNRPKRKLAAKFTNLPSEKEQEGIREKSVQKSPSQSSRFLQEYEPISCIGKGGFGRVFEARRKLEDQVFAVKIVASQEKSYREVSALVRLKHPNIVQYYTCWEEDTMYQGLDSDWSSNSSSNTSEKYLYIQMELCKSDDLKKWILENNESPKECRREEALDIVQQVVGGVTYIHSKNLIHRDLKPANILFGCDGMVKIADFGLVTFSENERDEALLQRTVETGTVSYMSPEQRESQQYDKKVDIFALGLIYFELVWPLKTCMEKRNLWPLIRKGTFPEEFISKYSPEHKLIGRMLAEDPKQRPEASDITNQLKRLSSLIRRENVEHQENRSI